MNRGVQSTAVGSFYCRNQIGSGTRLYTTIGRNQWVILAGIRSYTLRDEREHGNSDSRYLQSFHRYVSTSQHHQHWICVF